jgi:hypothetical protein
LPAVPDDIGASIVACAIDTRDRKITFRASLWSAMLLVPNRRSCFAAPGYYDAAGRTRHVLEAMAADPVLASLTSDLGPGPRPERDPGPGMRPAGGSVGRP